MNRRRFFQSLGAAVLGTAIALKIPEALIPQRPNLPDTTSSGVITWSMLEKAFNDIKNRGREPNIVIVPKRFIPYLESL